ncbi:MAG: hypothetical protein DIU68_002555 [Chloroflexota bacterium]|nr:MAG: hypothetical protein DIU68_10975 [Chloroflexota bacterium]
MVLNRIRLAALGLALLVAFAIPGTLLAQEATPEATETSETEVEITETPVGDLSYNTPVIGRIAAPGESQTWPLNTDSADRIRLVVERVDGNLIPTVVLLDADGNEIANAYGAEADGATAVITRADLPAAAEYAVRVESDDGETTGLYRLTVVPLGTAEDNINNLLEIGPINIGESIEGTITNTHWYHRYIYEAPAADAITVIAERAGGNLQPEVQILDANDSVLTTGYLEATGDRATIERYTLPSAGRYTIVITRDSGMSGASEGDYRLTLKMFGSGEGHPALEGIAGEIEYDTPLTGEITPLQWYQDWSLTAEAGDTITITVERPHNVEAGNLIPMVALLGGSGQEIMRGYPSNSEDVASIEHTTLSGPGMYTVRVMREGEQTGVTAGEYTLLVRLDGAGEGSASLEGSNGEVAVGDVVEGEVTNARWADGWIFNVTDGERVRIQATRTGGTLIPMIEIRDRNGQTLTTAYPESTRDTAILEYRPSFTGEVRVIVTRDRGQQGVTTGTYELSIEPAE